MEIKIIMGNFKMKGTLETREVKRGHIKPKVETMLQPKQGTTDRSINRILSPQKISRMVVASHVGDYNIY